ncbi:MAG: alcohol dehydrogenase catalytic domain-containing protein [Chloroflexi bacterium]|nr:alcohol dehydrogenase catalytic domain-containing protein [Chloroflexota bacterium]
MGVGDRVVYHYFDPCGRCQACFRGEDAAFVMNLLFTFKSFEPFPHFTGAYAEYYYLHPNQTKV